MLFQGDRILSERLRKGKRMTEFCDIFTLNTAVTLGRPVDTGVIALGRGTVNLLGRWCTWYFKHLLLLLLLRLLRSFVVLEGGARGTLNTFFFFFSSSSSSSSSSFFGFSLFYFFLSVLFFFLRFFFLILPIIFDVLFIDAFHFRDYISSVIDEWVWSIGGMSLARSTRG